MKTRMVTTAILAFFSTALFAQKMTYDAGKTTFGLRAGANFTTITGENAAGADVDYKIKSGFHAGVNAEIPFGSGLYLQPGVLYSQKGAEVEANGAEIRLSYVEVPVNLLYKPVLGAGRLLLGAGPYLGVGTNGRVKTTNGTKADVEFTTDYDENGSEWQFKRVDAGANLLVGYELKSNLSLQLNAQLGLKGLAAKNDDADIKNTGFGVSVGYRF